MMNAAEVLGQTISEPPSWDEICSLYPDQLVCQGRILVEKIAG